MPTRIEQRILADRVQDNGVLVPKLNAMLKHGVGIDSEADAEFLKTLAMKQVVREQERKHSGNTVYSPSGLASCLRRVYLSKNWQRLGLTRVELPAIGPHFYFLTGDFIHLKWQFVMWKMSQIPELDFTLIDCEVPVMSKRRDHGGTLDVIALNDGELICVDIKGLNVRGFQALDSGEPNHTYRIQVADYMMLWNAGVRHRLNGEMPDVLKALLNLDAWPKMTKGLILAENKGGPDPRHPGALSEYVVKLKDTLPEVHARLEALRAHEEEDSIPEIECRSTRGLQFEGCPFAEFCRKEIRAAERKDIANSDAREYRVARPKRAGRS